MSASSRAAATDSASGFSAITSQPAAKAAPATVRHSGRREIDDDAWLELGDRRDEAGTDGRVHPVLAQERLRPRAIEVDQPAELDVGKPRDHRQPQPARVARPDQEDAAHRSYQPGGDQMASSSGGAIPSGAAAQPTAFAIRRRTPSW